MCLAVYIASDAPLPLRAWNPEQPAFHVATLGEAGEASVRALGDYLAAATAGGQPVELFACWEGEQVLEPLHRRAMTPDDFRRPAFWFEPRTFAIVAPAD